MRGQRPVSRNRFGTSRAAARDNVCCMTAISEPGDERVLMPYLVGPATNIVYRGDPGSYPLLHQISQGVIQDPVKAQSVFWTLLIGAIFCRDAGKFAQWQERASGQYFEKIDQMLTLVELIRTGQPDSEINVRWVGIHIRGVLRSADPGAVLSDLTVAVLETTDRGMLENWIIEPPR